MNLVEPEVFLIAETRVNGGALDAALRVIDPSQANTGVAWLRNTLGRPIPDEFFMQTNEEELFVRHHDKLKGELLVQVAGRICYKSFGEGLNPNVKKIRKSSKDYFKNILKKGDGSILEHSTMTFAILNVSRVFTHELVRHRVGVAISQESGRYVRIDEEHPMRAWLPDLSEFNEFLKPEHRKKKQLQRSLLSTGLMGNSQGDGLAETMRNSEIEYLHLQNRYDWDAMSFDAKKKLTSALRRALPNGMANDIIWTVNHREFRHALTMRSAEAAEVEMRQVFGGLMAPMVVPRYPLIYQDFRQIKADDGGPDIWRPRNQKV